MKCRNIGRDRDEDRMGAGHRLFFLFFFVLGNQFWSRVVIPPEPKRGARWAATGAPFSLGWYYHPGLKTPFSPGSFNRQPVRSAGG
jgi:hypothetical protein